MTKFGAVVLSLPVAAVLLGALTLSLIYLGRYWGFGAYTLLLLVVPIALAAAYLAWYRTLPYEPVAPRPAGAAQSAAALDEPFEDPVEEADRYAQESGAEASEAPVGVPDASTKESPETP